MTDSWSEGPTAAESAESPANSRRVPQGSTPDDAGFGAACPVPGTPLTPMRPASRGQARATSQTSARMPTSSKPAKGKSGKTSSANPFVWDGGRVAEEGPEIGRAHV